MKANRERLLIAVSQLLHTFGLEEAILSLRYQFEDAEMAELLREAYVVGYRSVLTPDGYVAPEGFPFLSKIVEVRKAALAARLMTSKAYIESLRATIDRNPENLEYRHEQMGRLDVEERLHDEMVAELEKLGKPKAEPVKVPQLLSAKQEACLRAAAGIPGGVSPWSYGSGTIASLRKRHLIECRDGGHYVATAAGAAMVPR